MPPTVGPAHAGIEIIGGVLQGKEGFVSGRIPRSRRGKLYIDDSHWGPEADSLKSGYRAPIGSIQIFIAKTNRPEPKPYLEVHVEPQASIKPALTTPLSDASPVSRVGALC